MARSAVYVYEKSWPYVSTSMVLIKLELINFVNIHVHVQVSVHVLGVEEQNLRQK